MTVHRARKLSRTPRRCLYFVSTLLSGGALILGHPNVAVAGPHALWFVVHDICMADMKLRSSPFPCLLVDRDFGYAVIKNPRSSSEVLVVATTKLSGIEAPPLLAPSSPNYWQAAWGARRYVEMRIGRSLPRSDVGFAINSKYGRTQDQLHIHIDCVKPSVLETLTSSERGIGPRWAELSAPLTGRRYRAMWIATDDLTTRDPFKLLFDGDAKAREDMASETLAVIPMTLPDGVDGFVLLSRRADLAVDDKGASEELLDHSCRIAKTAAPAIQQVEPEE